MALQMQDTGEFKLVTYRKKRVFPVKNSCDPNIILFDDDDDSDTDTNYEALFGKLLEAETELRNSLYGNDVFHSLRDLLRALAFDGISEILCYGLGHFSRSKCSKYQLALLLSLKNYYGSRVHIYDPLFTPKEIHLLKRFGFNVIKINEEGKRVVQDNVTLVYMPHCSQHLTNNFLYANWSEKLSKCILLTNSFSVIAANTRKPVDYILRIQPYVREIVLRNNFKYQDVFNNLSIHTFHEQIIGMIPRSFWNEREDPCCRGAKFDYFTAKETEQIEAKNWMMKANVQLVRSLIKEIRQSSSERNAKDNIMVRYILEQTRAHRETSEVLCKAREELNNLAETYLCYLSSRRMCKEIQVRYTGKGERSIKETADLVGFKLPHDPK